MRWTVLFLLLFSFNHLVFAENNPFAKKTSLNVDEDVKWRMTADGASKTASDNKGLFYHLMYDAKQLRLSVSTDEAGSQAKQFTHLEVKDVLVDDRRLPLFSWCLNNQTDHSRYLQQGLSVKNDVCVVDGERGQVTLWLDAETVGTLDKGESLSIVIKPYRSSLSINYALADFSTMQAALAERSSPPVAELPVVAPKKQTIVESCWAKPPEKNQTIKAIKYTCGDAVAKEKAEAVIIKQLADARLLATKQKQERAQALALKQKKEAEKIARQKQLEKERQAKELEAARASQAKQQALASERLSKEKKVAENAAKQSELGVEITVKMVAMCKKYWDKGEHRCYCQKFIEYAPEDIQASSSCK